MCDLWFFKFGLVLLVISSQSEVDKPRAFRCLVSACKVGSVSLLVTAICSVHDCLRRNIESSRSHQTKKVFRFLLGIWQLHGRTEATKRQPGQTFCMDAPALDSQASRCNRGLVVNAVCRIACAQWLDGQPLH